MKICLVGDFSGNPDEGMKNIAFQLSEFLCTNNLIYKFNLSKMRNLRQFSDLIQFSPKIVIYIPGPSIQSFLLLKTLKLLLQRKTKTVIFATHPKLGTISYKLIPYLKPDLVIAISQKYKKEFEMLECYTQYINIGVDTEKFSPVSSEEKEKLRLKYGIDKQKFVVSHVGSIKKDRNVAILADLNNDKVQVVFVASITPGIENETLHFLHSKGCKIIAEYIPNIQEIYNFSDCYIFPTLSENKLNAIEIPLSVLESMACNLPVITTKFGGLSDMFNGTNGLFFVESDREIKEKLDFIMTSAIKVKTRDEVLKYSSEVSNNKIESCLNNLIMEV